MLKRNLVSLAALGVFAVLATGSTPGVFRTILDAASEGDDADFGDLDLGDDVFGGDMDGSGGKGNRAACVAYVEKYNSLPCLKDVRLDADEMCPGTLDMSPVDMTGYYRCLADGAKCNGAIPDLSGASNCRM